MITVMSARRARELEAAAAEVPWMTAALAEERQTVERLRGLLAEARAEAAAAREAGMAVSQETWEMYRAAQERAEAAEQRLVLLLEEPAGDVSDLMMRGRQAGVDEEVA